MSPQKTTQQRIGFVPGVAHFAIETVERTQQTTLAIMQDVRGELRTAVDNTIEFAEKAVGSLFRIARKLTLRIDEGAAATLGSAERLLDSAAQSARDTTYAATDLATSAVDGIVGTRAAS